MPRLMGLDWHTASVDGDVFQAGEAGANFRFANTPEHGPTGREVADIRTTVRAKDRENGRLIA